MQQLGKILGFKMSVSFQRFADQIGQMPSHPMAGGKRP
jgi:hypothetical protein